MNEEQRQVAEHIMRDGPVIAPFAVGMVAKAKESLQTQATTWGSQILLTVLGSVAGAAAIAFLALIFGIVGLPKQVDEMKVEFGKFRDDVYRKEQLHAEAIQQERLDRSVVIEQLKGQIQNIGGRRMK